MTCGFRHWKNATGKGGKLERHNISEKHQQAMLTWSDYKINQASHTYIASTLNTEGQEQIRKNRHYLKTVLEIIKFCSFQEIALRDTVVAINRGNFLELLDLLAEHDPVVKS